MSRKPFYALLALMIGCGVAVSLGDSDPSVSLDSARQIWADVLRDADDVSLQATRVSADSEMQLGRELAAGIGMNQRLAGVAAEIHADGVIDRRDAASAMRCHGQRLLPKTEENRVAPCAGAGGRGGEGGDVGGGVGGGGSRPAAGRRSYAVRCWEAATGVVCVSRGVSGTMNSVFRL